MANAKNNSNTTINENLFDLKNLGNIEWFNDIFDILNDDNDDNDNEQHENMMEEYNEDFDFDYMHTNVDEEEMYIEYDSVTSKNDKDNKIIEEQILSQKLSQLSAKDENDLDEDEDEEEDNNDEKCLLRNKKRLLSTSSPSSTSEVHLKKIRTINDNQNLEERIPNYLQITNEIFKKKMTEYVLNSTNGIITLEKIQQLALLKHKIAVMNIGQELWNVYLQVGTGQWKTPEYKETNKDINSVDRRFWPITIRKMISSKDHNANDIDKEKDEQKIYENKVNEQLQLLKKTIQQYQNEFNQTKNSLLDYTNDLENAIETLVQQYGIRLLQMKLNYKITKLEYDYDTEILERVFLQLKPTKNQKKIAQRLYQLKYDCVQSKYELIELKQRILCNQPTELMISKSLSMLTSKFDTMNNTNVNQYQKELEKNISQLIYEAIMETEYKIYESQKLFDKEILNISINENVENVGLTGKLVDLIYQSFNIINKKLEYMYNYKINFFRQNYGSYSQDNKLQNITNISFSPTIIINNISLLHQLTNEQWNLLKRGPTYIPPCQMYVSSSFVSMNEMIDTQYKVLQHHLSILFSKLDFNMARSMFISKEIKETFRNIFSNSLPTIIYQRALYEKQLVESIREHLKMKNLILRRTADQRNVFYLGNRDEFEDKANEYLLKTDVFEVSHTIDDNNLQQTHEYLSKIIKLMNSEIEKIFQKKNIFKDILEKLYININKVQLPYMYFLPNISEDSNLSVTPIIVSQYGATSRLARFLDRLIRPVVQRHTESTTFVNGADFIRKLNVFSNEEHQLHPTTIFTTIEILNYYTMTSHKTMLIILADFLNNHLAYPGIENISIQKIIDLTTLFLNNNQFYYDNKIYRFTKGSPNSLLLTETLCNICAFQWQKSLLRTIDISKEVYGRYKNQIFFTWNKTVNEFRQLIKVIGQQYPNIQLNITMSSETHYLDVYIKNQNGILYTCVYHDSNIQKYTLPYVVTHTKEAHSHWLRSALIRAVRYCTLVDDFNQERINLEITCLTNGYSLEFVEHRIHQFFTFFDVTSLRFILDQNIYDKLRHRLFNFISEQRLFFSSQQELEKKNQRIQLTYLYQFGSKYQFNKKLKQILFDNLKTYDPSLKNKMKILIRTKQQYSLNALLSQQKPYHNLLNKDKKNNFFN